MLSQTLFKFNTETNINHWVVTDDVVMGGESSGSFSLSPEGYGEFKGNVSLKNNGGFSSVRYKFQTKNVTDYNHVVLRIKGDGKNYQFRVKANSSDYYSYIAPFKTSGEWQEVTILLQDMYPAFRGKTLDKPNFDKNHIEELTFLIANKKQEDFKLLIDFIELR